MKPQASGFVFAPGGARVYVRTLDGSLAIFHIPNSSHDEVHPPRVFTPDEGQVVVAVGQLWPGKRTVVVTQSYEALHLSFLDGKAQTQRTIRASLRNYAYPIADAGAPLETLGVIHDSAACFVHTQGTLVQIIRDHVEIDAGHGIEPLPLLAHGGRARKPLPEGLVFTSTPSIGDPNPRVKFAVAWHHGVHVEDCFERFEPSGPTGPIFLGISGIASSMVWQGENEQWFFKPSRRSLKVTAHLEVFGMIERGMSEPKPYLAVLDASRKSIGFFTEDGFQPLHESADRIAFAATSSAARHIAYLNESGEVVVLSSDSGVELLRARLPAGP